MSQQPGLTDFFAMEAGDYLQRLDAVVSHGQSPNAEEFTRLARALRGSALMANQQAIAAAAGGLEQLARASREGKRPWDPATKQLVVRAVDDLKVLVRKLASWSPAEDAKARRLAEELHLAVGGQVSPAPSARAPDPGTRAFIAQQGATLASALDRTATSLTQHPDKREVLPSTLKFLQPLRGIAGLADFPPLPDLLEGIERGIAQLTRGGHPAGNPAAMFRAAAKAIARAAREVANAGKADPNAPEVAEFVRLLGGVLEGAADVVPIESLYYSDAGPHVVQPGTAPARPSQLSDLELVAHGEHLRQAADALERVPPGPQRELRAQALAGTFAALASVGAGVFGTAVVAFARAAREALARGMAAAESSRLVESMRQAAGVLTAAGREAETALAQRLAGVTAGLAAGAGGTAAAAPVAPRRTAAAPVVPAAPAAPSVPAPATAAAPEEDGFGLAASFTRYERYVATLGMRPGSLEELLAGPPAVSAVPAVAAVAAVPAMAAADTAGTAGTAETVLPITEICYSGPAAIERALSLRAEVRSALAGSSADSARINDLLEEIFDLVQLGTGHKQ